MSMQRSSTFPMFVMFQTAGATASVGVTLSENFRADGFRVDRKSRSLRLASRASAVTRSELENMSMQRSSTFPMFVMFRTAGATTSVGVTPSENLRADGFRVYRKYPRFHSA